MTAMELVISEITFRATSKVIGKEAHPQRIEAVAAPLAEALVDLVVAQGSNPKSLPVVDLKTYMVWELWNRILDEIEKEIPIASKIQVNLIGGATRAERKAVTEETWRSTVSQPIHKQE
jgi:hypothetical protein